MIWKQAFTLQYLNQQAKGTLIQHLGIEYSAKTDNSLSATMPVAHFTQQPFGALHGGASVVLAETLASVCGNMCVDEEHYCIGLEVNANHIRAARNGVVTGSTIPTHIGRSTQLWQVEIRDEGMRLVCSAKVTLMVVEK